jgi:hypothetical protein
MERVDDNIGARERHAVGYGALTKAGQYRGFILPGQAGLGNPFRKIVEFTISHITRDISHSAAAICFAACLEERYIDRSGLRC